MAGASVHVARLLHANRSPILFEIAKAGQLERQPPLHGILLMIGRTRLRAARAGAWPSATAFCIPVHALTAGRTEHRLES